MQSTDEINSNEPSKMLDLLKSLNNTETETSNVCQDILPEDWENYFKNLIQDKQEHFNETHTSFDANNVSDM